MKKIIIVLANDCLQRVYSDEKVEIEVIDLGDVDEERPTRVQKKQLKQLEKLEEDASLTTKCWFYDNKPLSYK